MENIISKFGEHEIVYIKPLNMWKVPDSLLPPHKGEFESLEKAEEFIIRREENVHKQKFTPFEAVYTRWGNMDFVTVTSYNPESGKCFYKNKHTKGYAEICDIKPISMNMDKYKELLKIKNDIDVSNKKIIVLNGKKNDILAAMKSFEGGK